MKKGERKGQRKLGEEREEKRLGNHAKPSKEENSSQKTALGPFFCLL